MRHHRTPYSIYIQRAFPMEQLFQVSAKLSQREIER